MQVSDREAAGLRSRMLVPVLVLLGLVVAAVGSLGAPLVPTVAAVDRVSVGSAQWTLTVTLLVGAVATPVLGRLGDGPRRRRTVLGALAVVLAGSVLTALPLGFGMLLAGRAAQGVGLGLTSLAIAVARDHLVGERARSAVSLLSITTVAGVGLGYPLAGVLVGHLGLRAAYGSGAAVVAAVMVLAALVLPADPDRPARPLDLPGAVLLGTGLTGLLLVLGEAAAWSVPRWVPVVLVAGAIGLLTGWVRRELRTAHPLVDLRALRVRAVASADLTVLVGGVGMYLLLSLVTRFVQTPTRVGYGFGASVVVAGLVLTPFSLLGFAANKAAPALARRTSPEAVLPIGCGVVLLATLGFLAGRGQLWQVFAVMAVAGFGVGCAFSAVPGLVVRAVPASETASAMGLNQVLRTVGFSAGSALSALVLDAHTAAGRALPEPGGYRAAALVGVGVLAASVALGAALGIRPGRRRPSGVADPVPPG